MEKRYREKLTKQNSFKQMKEKHVEFRGYEAIPILSVPDIVVRERVDVHLETVVIVEVDVGYETVR